MLDFFVSKQSVMAFCSFLMFSTFVHKVKNVFISSVNNATNFLIFKRNYNSDFNAVAFSIVVL